MPQLDLSEALRYAGVQGDVPEELLRAMADVARQATAIAPRSVWRAFPVRREADRVVLEGSGVALTGELASRTLADCGEAALLLCTLGEPFDALLRREQARDMARAVLLDACGSAWVEAACDETEREIARRFPGAYLTDRFSPGYGDLPLEIQGALCAALDAQRRAGVHVTGSFLLNPGKSVTAVVGLSSRPQPARIRGCEYCAFRENCALRKGGKTCAD